MFKRIFVLFSLTCLIALFFHYSGFEYLSFESLKLHKQELLIYAEANFWQTFFLTAGIYIFATILNLPVAAIMSLAIGFIFGRWYGVMLASIASTIGAVLVFWLARYLIADWARHRLAAMKATKKAVEKLHEDIFAYLILMRAVPLFPFWFVNMTFAFSLINTRKYALGTFLGMLPVNFVLVNLGQSLSTVDSIEQLFTLEVIASFVLIGVLALITSSILRRRNKDGTINEIS